MVLWSRDGAHGLSVGVREAIGVVDPWTHMHLGGPAHQVVIVGAFGTLTGADVGEYLGQPSVHADIDEGGAGGMIFSAADGNGGRVAVRVVIEGAIAHTAVGYVRRHWIFLRGPAALGWAASEVHGRWHHGKQKDPIV